MSAATRPNCLRASAALHAHGRKQRSCVGILPAAVNAGASRALSPRCSKTTAPSRYSAALQVAGASPPGSDDEDERGESVLMRRQQSAVPLAVCLALTPHVRACAWSGT